MLEAQSLPQIVLSLAVASAIGTVLGLEREMSHKPAGLRTLLLVSVGTALFVMSGRSISSVEVGRIAANVVTGLGFLGAGVILQHRGTVRGLTTAALIWVNGALGLAAALERYDLAVTGSILALLALRLLGPLEKRLGLKCRVVSYQVTAHESDAVVRAVNDELGRSHFQDGPLSFDRKDGRLLMRFAFCNPPTRHDRFVEVLRKLPDVIEVGVA